MSEFRTEALNLQPMLRTVLKAIVKVLLVSGECLVAGFIVGTAAHFVGGAFGFGLGLGALELAAGEGGLQGAVIGLFVGLLVFYAILRGRATWKQWLALMAVSFVTASLTFMPLGIMTLVVTPVVTLVVAVAIGVGRWQRD